jgi:hypothetical protein
MHREIDEAMLRIRFWRDEMRMATGVTIQDTDKEQSVIDYLTDEELRDSSFSPRAVKIAFMDRMCQYWYTAYGTRIEAIQEADYVEWIVRYVEDNVEVRNQQALRSLAPVDSLPIAETNSDVGNHQSD